MFSLARAAVERADVATDIPGTPSKPTQIEMVHRRITLTTGEASITLDGPDVRIEAAGEISIMGKNRVVVRSHGDDVQILGGPRILLNPPDENAIIPEEDEPPPDEIA